MENPEKKFAIIYFQSKFKYVVMRFLKGGPFRRRIS